MPARGLGTPGVAVTQFNLGRSFPFTEVVLVDAEDPRADFDTIPKAIAFIDHDGVLILVGPGTYSDPFTCNRDVTIWGFGRNYGFNDKPRTVINPALSAAGSSAIDRTTAATTIRLRDLDVIPAWSGSTGTCHAIDGSNSGKWILENVYVNPSTSGAGSTTTLRGGEFTGGSEFYNTEFRVTDSGNDITAGEKTALITRGALQTHLAFVCTVADGTNAPGNWNVNSTNATLNLRGTSVEGTLDNTTGSTVNIDSSCRINRCLGPVVDRTFRASPQLGWDPCRVSTNANVTLAGSAPDTEDGVSLAVDDRILVRAQTAGAENGIYVVQTLGTGSDGTWVRSADAQDDAQFRGGKVVAVSEGTARDNTFWFLETNDSIVVDTTALTFGEKGVSTTDTDAIHDNVANEFTDVPAEKTALVDADKFLVEDSEAGGVKKHVQFGNLPFLADFKDRVHAATVAALPANTSSGTGVGKTLTADSNGALSVDGRSMAVDERVLVKNEVTASDNGIYDVTQVGSGGTPYILTRATDYDESGDVRGGGMVPVSEGGTNNNTLWMMTTDGAITVDTTGLVFADRTGTGGGAGWPFTGDVHTVHPTDADADFSTVQAALDAMSAGDAVWPASGDYNEELDLKVNGFMFGWGVRIRPTISVDGNSALIKQAAVTAFEFHGIDIVPIITNATAAGTTNAVNWDSAGALRLVNSKVIPETASGVASDLVLRAIRCNTGDVEIDVNSVVGIEDSGNLISAGTKEPINHTGGLLRIDGTVQDGANSTGDVLFNNSASVLTLGPCSIEGTLTLSNALTATRTGATFIETLTDSNNLLLNVGPKGRNDAAIKRPVRLATAAALPANTAAGSGVGKTLTADANGSLSVDGVTVSADDRILVQDEVTSLDNGVYVVTQVGSGALPYILTRATDFDNGNNGDGITEVEGGVQVAVQEGTANAGKTFFLNTSGTITIDTTALTFDQLGPGLIALVDDTTPQLGGTLDAQNNDIDDVKVASFGATLFDNGSSGVSATINWNNGNIQKIDLTSTTVTLSFTDPPGVGHYQLVHIQDATGGRDPVWPSNVHWDENGTEPAWTTSANAVNIATFLFDGTNYLGQGGRNFAA